jgi:hypothetical protein
MRRFMLFAALVVVAGLAIVLLRDEPPADRGLELPDTPSAPLAGESHDAPEVDVTTRAVAESSPDPTANDDDDPRPASFVAALGAVTGRVVDRDGSPIGDFPVDLVGGYVGSLLPAQSEWLDLPEVDFKLERLVSRTDAQGRFRIERVDPDGYYLFELGRGTPRRKIDLCPGVPDRAEVLDVGDLKLDAFAVLVGRVVDDQKKPIAGASVKAIALPAELSSFGLHRVRRGAVVAFKEPSATEWRTFDLPPIVNPLLELMFAVETTSGEDGTFRLEGVPLSGVSVVAEIDGRVESLRGPFGMPDGGEREVGDFVLERGESLDVRVVGGDDEGVAGAKVLAGPILSIFPVALLLPRGETNAEGEIAVEGLTTERHLVAARRKEGVTWVIEGPVDPGVDEPLLRVDDLTSLLVRVADGAGERLAGARVRLQKKSEMSSFPLLEPPLVTAGRTSESDEGIRVEGLSCAEYVVTAKLDGFAASQQDVDLRQGTATLDFALAREQVATVRVIAQATREPVEHAYVLVRAKDDDEIIPLPIAPLAAGRTDRDGLIALRGLDAGAHGIDVVHPAFAPQRLPLTVPGEPLLVELRGGGRLHGRVLRDGEPIGEPYLVAATFDGESLDVMPRITRVDPSDSTYSFSRLPEGTYEVHTLKDLESLNALSSGSFFGSSDAPFMMFAGAEPPAMEPQQEVELEVDPFVDAPATAPEASPTRGSGGVTVQVGNAPPRVHREESGPPIDTAVRVFVREGGEALLDVDVARLPGATPRGRVAGTVYVNGAPRGDLLVTGQHGSGTSRDSRTDALGRFDLGELPEGKVDVTVLRAATTEERSELHSERIELAAGESRRLELRVEAGSVKGDVRSAKDGRPLGDATVQLIRTPDPGDSGGVPSPRALSRIAVVTRADGTFEAPLLPAGKYQIEAVALRFAKARVQDVVVPRRGSPPPVRLALLEAVRVEGRVALPPDDESRMMFVHLRPLEQSLGFDFTGIAFVDPATKAFTVDGLAPGEYLAHVGGERGDYEPHPLSVPPQGLSNVVLTMQPKAPPQLLK